MTDWNKRASEAEGLQSSTRTDWEAKAKEIELTGSGRTIAGSGGIPRDQAMEQTKQAYMARQPQSGFKSVPEKGASFKTIAGASLADDPAVKMEYYAQKRFPNLPIEESIKRYTLMDGEIAYQDEDGEYYTETPTMGDRVAMHLGKAIPVGAGTVAGVATAPLWLAPGGGAAATALTGAAAYAGEEVRQALGKKVTGDPVSKTEPLKEGAYAAGGELIGGVATKVTGRRVAKDFSRLDAEDAAVLQRLSEKYGVDLTPAEITNLPSLKARQKAVGNLPESADTMGDFYVKRAGQVDEAVDTTLEEISPVDSAEVAGELTRSAARNAMSDVAKQRADLASPLYKKAFGKGTQVDVGPIIDDIDQQLLKAKGGIKTRLEQARKLFVDSVEKVGEEDEVMEFFTTDLEELHNVKMALYDLYKSPPDSGAGRTAAGKVEGVYKRLIGKLKEASPDYKQANEIWADLSPEVSKAREGVVGVIADLKDESLQKAASKLFAPGAIGPKSINNAKILLKHADPNAWQAIKRSWIEDQWEQASKQTMSNQGLNRGARFRALLFGDKKRARNLRAALDPKEYDYLEELSKVLEASGRVKQIGSDTAWNQEMMRELGDEAAPVWAKIAENVNPAQALRNLKDWATKRSVRTLAKDMAEVITSPDAMANLKELQQLTPGSAKAAVLTAHILGLTAASAASAGTEALKQGLQ